MKMILAGACGRMGQEVVALTDAKYHGFELVGAVDPTAAPGSGFVASFDALDCPDAEVIVDFSHHSALPALLRYAVAHRLPVVIAPTGHTEQELACMQEAAKEIPVFFAANMSVGVALLVDLAKKAAAVFPDADIEIVETHHNRKQDAPSGTAHMLANALQTVRSDASLCFGRNGMQKRVPGEIGVHAVRRGNIVGIHEVLISTDTQTITLKHEAHHRSLFAEGALAAAEFIATQPAGLYGMQDMLNTQR